MTQAAFSDYTNPNHSPLPKILQRKKENPPIASSNFPAESVRFSGANPSMEVSYLNVLSLNNQMLNPYLKQFMLSNRNRRHMPISMSVTQGPITNTYEIEETGELVKSVIEGEIVMGFNVWGEVRLCLPHLLRFVLNDVDIDEIGQAISKLKIACTKCSPSQLSSLHNCNALPSAVTSCGLIRKSDAERMLKFLSAGKQRPTLDEVRLRNSKGKDLIDGVASHTIPSIKSEESTSKSDIFEEHIDVRHDCFGSQKGRVYPHLYSTPTSPCILCQTCDKLFSPSDFVGHTHVVTELDTCCHWGFDSTNWRSYLRLDLHDNPNLKAETRSRLLSSDQSDSDTYRILNEFKAKFLKPLKLPDALLAKLGHLENRTNVPKPVVRSLDVPLDCRTIKSSPTTTSYSTGPELGVLRATLTSPSSHENDSTTTGTTSIPLSPLKCRLPHPRIKLRRLWAPHGGQVHIPHPPNLISDCLKGPRPSNLSVDGPILMDPSCVVTKDSAHLYDRDFIPNVCLKPMQPANLSKSLLSVPSNDDIFTTGKRSYMEEIFPMKPTSQLSNRYRISRRITPNDCMLRSVSKSCHGFNSTTISPARTRHSSCVQERIAPIISCSTKQIKNGVLLTRSPSADFLKESFKAPLSRTISNPELRTQALVTISSKLSMKRSHFEATTTPLFSIGGKRCPVIRNNYCSQQSICKTGDEPLAGKNKSLSISVPPESESDEQRRSSCPSFQAPPEPTINWMAAADSNTRIPNLVSHWVNLLERVNSFCGAVGPSTTRQSSSLFESERVKLFTELHLIREKHFADLSMVLEENRKLWKLLTDALMLSGTSSSLTPVTCAPPFSRIPGVTNQFPEFLTPQASRPMSNHDRFPPNATQPSQDSRFNANDRSKLSLRVGGGDGHPGQESCSSNLIAGMDLNEAISAYLVRQAKLDQQKRTQPLPNASNATTSVSYPPKAGSDSGNGEFLLPNKRQRLLL